MANLEDVDVTSTTDDPREREELESYDWGSASISRKDGIRTKVVVPTDDYYAKTDDEVILMANILAVATVYLPKSSIGKRYTIKMLDTNRVTVSAEDGDIDGFGAYTILSQYDFIEVVFNGEDWHIISKYEL